MGRRKKEPESIHREAIALAAEALFVQKGIDATTMDDIAKEAGYSKATLYVYFTNKEEIIGYLVLKSMRMLHSFFINAVSEPATIKEKYNQICKALMEYQEKYPLYFNFALSEINVDFEKKDFLFIEKEIFEVGEQINEELIKFVRAGCEAGEFQSDIPVLQTLFVFWGSLAGLIQLAANKQLYIERSMNLTKTEFLEFGFEKLFQMIAIKN